MAQIKHTQTFKFRPRPKQRPRLGRRGRVFTPAETLAFEQAVKDCYTGPLFETGVNITITLGKDSFTVTLSEHANMEPSPLRGDIDNYAKSIMDGLNGVAYTDDRLVRKLQVTKK